MRTDSTHVGCLISETIYDYLYRKIPPVTVSEPIAQNVNLLIVTFYIFAATYFKTPFLIGNFAMLKRSAFCIEDGYSLTTGICVELLVIVVCITVGLIRIRKYDILNKEN